MRFSYTVGTESVPRAPTFDELYDRGSANEITKKELGRPVDRCTSYSAERVGTGLAATGLQRLLDVTAHGVDSVVHILTDSMSAIQKIKSAEASSPAAVELLGPPVSLGQRGGWDLRVHVGSTTQQVRGRRTRA